MVKKPVGAAPSQKLSPDDLKRGIDRLNLRIRDVEGFDPRTVKQRWSPEVQALTTAIEDSLAKTFGAGTVEYDRHAAAAQLDKGGYSMGEDSPNDIIDFHVQGKAQSLALLKQVVRGLTEDLEETGAPAAKAPTVIAAPTQVLSKEIFVVHGRDDAAKTEVARLIERAGLVATILHEQANGGRTIIEKFEKHGGSAGFAVVIMTPDDVGGLDDKSLQPRARQNVIGEMFWFAGRLGRERVCALKKGLIEVPTDFAGVGYVDMDASGAWKKDVLRELDHAGYKNIDWSKALA
jgi:predicted nucleotide-binding protein